MTFFLIAVLLVVVLSTVLIRAVERDAEKVNGTRLPRGRRWLIPVPILLFLAANVDGVFSLLAYLESHPNAAPYRYSDHQAWSTDRFMIAGLVAVGLLPFLLVRRPYRFPMFVMRTWFVHLVWVLIPFVLLALASGVPLQD